MGVNHGNFSNNRIRKVVSPLFDTSADKGESTLRPAGIVPCEHGNIKQFRSVLCDLPDDTQIILDFAPSPIYLQYQPERQTLYLSKRELGKN